MYSSDRGRPFKSISCMKSRTFAGFDWCLKCYISIGPPPASRWWRSFGKPQALTASPHYVHKTYAFVDLRRNSVEPEGTTRVRVGHCDLTRVGAVSYRTIVLSSESDRWVRHTHEVLETLQSLLSADMEGSNRATVDLY